MLKKLVSLTLILVLVPVLLLMTVLPALIGVFIRPSLLQVLEQAQVLNINIQRVRAGWFSSDIHVSAESSIFSTDGLSPITQQAILHMNHGPIMWHLYDTLIAVADIRLLPAPEQAPMMLTPPTLKPANVRIARSLFTVSAAGKPTTRPLSS